ncbi:hypothetical protein BWK58_14605 [Flavobacterium columnare]|nr:hypothetical protein BWK58_14605 [Flavobacterium columnare]
MKLISKIDNCADCILLESNLVFESKGSVYINNKEFGSCSIYDISIYNSILYFYKESELFEIVNNSELIRKFHFENINNISIVSKNTLEVYKRISRKELEYIFYDFNYKKLWENIGDESVDIVNENYVKLRGRLEVDINSFTIRNINDGLPIWKYSLPDGFNIYLKLNTIDNILFFTAYDSNNRYQLLTGLDIETGAIVWQNCYEVTSEHKFISAPAFNKNDQLYYGIGSVYQVFNPKTGEIVLEKIFDECKNYNLLVDAQAVYDNKLWFVSGGGKNSKFGYVNIDTHQLEFMQDLPHEEYEVFDTPIFHEGKLYLRGKHQNILYVFE